MYLRTGSSESKDKIQRDRNKSIDFHVLNIRSTQSLDININQILFCKGNFDLDFVPYQ